LFYIAKNVYFKEIMNQTMKSFLAGVRAESPLLIGVFPFGLIYGALAIGAGISPAAAQMMSSIVFAGSSQFIAAQLIHDAAPGLVIVLTIAVVNLRHMLYSASVAPYIEHLPPPSFITRKMDSPRRVIGSFSERDWLCGQRGRLAVH
jgi:predicted branched-subunit amino acid permease